MQGYRLRLALTWLVGGGIILMTMILQTTLGHYGEEAQDAWEWLLPNIVPTLTLVLGVTAFTKPATRHVPASARSLFMLSVAASIFYLLALALPIFLQPLVAGPPLPVLRQSSLWLGPLQGLTSSLLGVFFTRETPA